MHVLQFLSKRSQPQSLVDEYFEASNGGVETEGSNTPWAQSGLFHAVYIGGGTPTDLIFLSKLKN